MNKLSNLSNNKSIENLCRICLTPSKRMISLNSLLNSKKDNTLVIEALQKVMSVQIACDNRYPSVICPMCLGLLKLSYDLKLQFTESQKVLRDYFKDNFDPLLLNEPKENYEIDSKDLLPGLSPVEIIIGHNKYNLSDVVIVEEDKEDRAHFKGFLDNLGKTITARFVNKSYKPTQRNIQPKPIVLIEKININNNKNNTHDSKRKDRKPTDELTEANLSKYMVTEIDDVNKTFSTGVFKDLNLEKFGLKNPTHIDHELFQSALSMQLKCDRCQKFYSSKGRFRRHLEVCGKLEYQITENDAGQPTITAVPSILQCPICTRTFKERKFLNHHIKSIHNMESKYTCEICGHTLRNRHTFMYHKRTRHGERKFKCEMCGKKFFTSSSLKAHTLNHRNVTQCICPICGKTFHYKGGLFYHMKLHTNERKYCCEFCDRKFYTLMSLKRHTLTHTGYRPYACKFCEKRFFSTGEVRKHEYLHTGFKPYHCPYCKKGFTSGYNMKVHLVSHPGPFSCKYCDRTFVTNNVLKFHHKMKHAVIEYEESP